MKKEVIFELKSLYRDNMKIDAYIFGSGKKSAVIAGAVRGNEIQQLYCASKLVEKLGQIESDKQIADGKSIMIVPCINPYSVNTEKRFWPTDNTDINRMFPGYSLGETTQRIAAGVFEKMQGYEYGIHFTSNYIPGSFVPHIRIMKTGFEDIEKAKDFGLKYISVRETRPFDTTTLNYNWQIWNTKAYSILTSATSHIDRISANEAVNAVLRFLEKQNIITYKAPIGAKSQIINENELLSLKAKEAGIFEPFVSVSENVTKGEPIARILDSCNGSVKAEIKAPADCEVFFLQTKPLAYADSVIIKLLKKN